MKLAIEPGRPVLRLLRRRLAGQPLAILENFLPPDLLGQPGTDLSVAVSTRHCAPAA